MSIQNLSMQARRWVLALLVSTVLATSGAALFRQTFVQDGTAPILPLWAGDHEGGGGNGSSEPRI